MAAEVNPLVAVDSVGADAVDVGWLAVERAEVGSEVMVGSAAVELVSEEVLSPLALDVVGKEVVDNSVEEEEEEDVGKRPVVVEEEDDEKRDEEVVDDDNPEKEVVELVRSDDVPVLDTMLLVVEGSPVLMEERGLGPVVLRGTRGSWASRLTVNWTTSSVYLSTYSWCSALSKYGKMPQHWASWLSQ